MAELIKGLTYDTFGTTVRVKIGNYNRKTKTLKTNNYLFFEKTGEQEFKFLKRTNVENDIKFIRPVVGKCKFNFKELNKYFMILEKEQW